MSWLVNFFKRLFGGKPNNPPPPPPPEPNVPHPFVEGVALDDNSNPIVGATVTETDSGRTSTSDGNGYWVFETRSAHVYRFEHPDFHTSDRDLAPWDQQHRVHLDRVAPPPPPPPPAHPDPIPGQITIRDGAFRDGHGQPRALVFLHAGDLIGQGLTFGLDRVLPIFDLAASVGYHGIRSWFNLYNPSHTGWWGDKPAKHWDPRENPGLFRQILAAARDRGLKWHLASAGLIGLTDPEEDAIFHEVTNAIGDVGPECIAQFEACNEVRDTGDRDDLEPAELEGLVRIPMGRFPQILYSLSAYTGHEDREVLRRYTMRDQQFYLVHGFRDNQIWDKWRHIFSLGYSGEAPTVRRLGWQGEPFGPGRRVSAQNGAHQLTPGNMAIAGCMAAMTRQAWTFMSGPGVILYDEDMNSMPGFRETPEVMRRLPQDIMTYDIIGHSGREGSPRIHACVTDAPDVRADYAIQSSTGRYVEITYGPANQRKNLPQVRGTRDVETIIETPEGRVQIGQLA